MKARVTITKSFDEERDFSKEWQKGDFEEFFQEEGVYLDQLSEVAKEKGKDGSGKMFTVTYTVTVEK